MRGSVAGLAVVGAMIALVSAAPAAEAASKGGCGPAKAHTEARSPWLRVYSRYRQDGDDEFTDFFACLRRGGKPLKLAERYETIQSGSGQSSPFITAFALAGRYVAFADGDCSLFSCQFTFRVVDVRRRKVTRSVHQPRGIAGHVVVTFSGRAAILAGSDPDREPYVLKLDADGAVELDRGSGVRDLKLSGRTLYWLHGEEERSAELR
jgi:hypothetical protein